ncbi:hypothetical protein L1049_016796 [Liquidambar formosana]|uniref:Uncharacterized protein n=1 Tax=Liquidambar formosana TaxID=63359 RepID=A0AAP0S236_LIQFO
MRNTRVRPLIVSNWSNTSPYESLQANDYGGSFRRGCDYWYARQAFLNSYHFSEQNGFKEKLRRSVKELNELAMGLISEIRQEMAKRRLGTRVFKFRLGWPSLAVVRCFTPWLHKIETVGCDHI